MTDYNDDGTIRAHWPPLPKVLDADDPEYVQTLVQSVRYLETELYRVQDERDRLREPVSANEYFNACIIGGDNKAVAVMNRILAARAKESSNG